MLRTSWGERNTCRVRRESKAADKDRDGPRSVSCSKSRDENLWNVCCFPISRRGSIDNLGNGLTGPQSERRRISRSGDDEASSPGDDGPGTIGNRARVTAQTPDSKQESSRVLSAHVCVLSRRGWVFRQTIYRPRNIPDVYYYGDSSRERTVGG